MHLSPSGVRQRQLPEPGKWSPKHRRIGIVHASVAGRGRATSYYVEDSGTDVKLELNHLSVPPDVWLTSKNRVRFIAAAGHAAVGTSCVANFVVGCEQVFAGLQRHKVSFVALCDRRGQWIAWDVQPVAHSALHAADEDYYGEDMSTHKSRREFTNNVRCAPCLAVQFMIISRVHWRQLRELLVVYLQHRHCAEAALSVISHKWKYKFDSPLQEHWRQAYGLASFEESLTNGVVGGVHARYDPQRGEWYLSLRQPAASQSSGAKRG